MTKLPRQDGALEGIGALLIGKCKCGHAWRDHDMNGLCSGCHSQGCA